jgi:proteasome lid subunit RPN8/RPN11
MFTADIEQAAKAHALSEWPKESVGLVTGGSYVPVPNLAEDPTQGFAFDKQLMLTPELRAIIHSHPSGRINPSKLDMQQQLATDLPWGIVGCNNGATTDIFWWGPGVQPPPLKKRGYRFGPSGSDGKGDCYAIIRDWYKLERGIELMEIPRDEEEFKAEYPFYDSLFATIGSREIQPSEVDVGDVVLIRIRQEISNHALLYIGKGLALHHAGNQLSAEVPIGPWLRFRTRCLRYTGAPVHSIATGQA